MSNGTLLHPSKPLTAVDAAFASFVRDASFESKPNKLSGSSIPSVWGSYMNVSVQLTAHSILSVNLTRNRFAVTPKDDLWPAPRASVFIHWLWQGRACSNGTFVAEGGCVSQVETGDSVDVSCAGASAGCISTDQAKDLPFALHLFAPYVHGFALLGEMGKFVPLSPARFSNVDFTATGMAFDVRGAPQEDVLVSVVRPPGQVHVLPVRVPGSGRVRVRVP